MSFQFREPLQIQPKHPMTFAAHNIPAALGVGYRTYNPSKAVEYVKRGETLNPTYYDRAHALRDEFTEEWAIGKFLEGLGAQPNAHLTNVIGRPVYGDFADCNSAFFKEEITPTLALVAYVDGLTTDGGLIKEDRHITRIWPTTQAQCETILLASMAVYKCSWGIYYMPNSQGQDRFYLTFDEARWAALRKYICKWVTTYVTPN
jgi:hypothetical protein